MELKEIKTEMKKYTDLLGRSLLSSTDIDDCDTKEELAAIIEEHNDHLEDVLNDTQNSLGRFKERLGLTNL